MANVLLLLIIVGLTGALVYTRESIPLRDLEHELRIKAEGGHIHEIHHGGRFRPLTNKPA